MLGWAMAEAVGGVDEDMGSWIVSRPQLPVLGLYQPSGSINQVRGQNFVCVVFMKWGRFRVYDHDFHPDTLQRRS
jgi:hypothetical protein